MSSLFYTLSLAFFAIIVALVLLLVRWLITGKFSLFFGFDSNKKHTKEDDKDADCQLCNKDDTKS